MTIKNQWLVIMLSLLASANNTLFGADHAEHLAGTYKAQQQANQLLLLAAAKSNVPACIKLLMERNADPNAIDEQKRSALFLALTNPTENTLNLIKTLIEHGIDIQGRIHIPEHKRDNNPNLPAIKNYLKKVISGNKKSIQQFLLQLTTQSNHFDSAQYGIHHEFLNWSIGDEDLTPLELSISHRKSLDFIKGIFTPGGHKSARRKKGIVRQALNHGLCDTAYYLVEQRCPTELNEIPLIIARTFSLPDNDLKGRFLATMAQTTPMLPKETQETVTAIISCWANDSHFTSFPTQSQSLVVSAILAAGDEERAAQFIPLCTKQALNMRAPHLVELPLELACLRNKPRMIRCMLEYGADPELRTVEGLSVWEKARSIGAHDAVEQFRTLIEKKANELVEQEDRKEALRLAKEKAQQAQRKPINTLESGTSEEEHADFQDPDGNWVIHGLAALLHSSSPVAEHVPAAGGSPEQTKRRTLTVSYYDYHARVQRWVSDPQQVFIDDPEYADCPEDQHAATIMRHAACQIIDTHTADCCITEKDESDVIVALCPCLIIPDQGTPETRIFKCCVDLRTKSVFHRFFHKSSQAPEIFSVFHALPTVGEHTALAGAGTPHDIGPDGSRLVAETEEYIKYYDPKFAVTIYCAKPKQEAIQ